MKRIVSDQTLIASVTSEVGTAGDTRSSVCAIEREGDTFKLEKAATTVSYGQHADALLVTARRAPDAAASDQVLVYLEKDDYSLTPTSNWETLGMRGHLQPWRPVECASIGRPHLPGSFADLAPRRRWSLFAHPMVRLVVRHRLGSRLASGRFRPRRRPREIRASRHQRPAPSRWQRPTCNPCTTTGSAPRPNSTLMRGRPRSADGDELGVEDEQPEDPGIRSGPAASCTRPCR